MESADHLKLLLQLQLATDSSAVIHLPYVLATLTPDSFLPSPHLSKWTTRVSSLLHSKDPGGRWAGLCLAHKTSTASQSIMIEFAQSWLGAALPMLSRNEPTPNLKSAVRLLKTIFTAAIDVGEFQRQVSAPNVAKFTAAVIALAENHVDIELKILLLTTLARIIPLYPTLHRALYNALSALSLQFLSGSAPNPTNGALLEAASRLYSVLHFISGKVGAATIWRKSVDETLAFGWSAFFGLRTTFSSDGRNGGHQATASSGEPSISIPLNLDRLRCCIVVLCDLLSTVTHRPVQAPLGSLLKFTTTLLACTAGNRGEGHVDSVTHVLEVSVIPEIWKLGCHLVIALAKCARHHMTPSLTRLASYLTFHLEQKPTPSQRLVFLSSLQALLSHCYPLDSPLVPTRLMKAILPLISVILTTAAETRDAGTTTTKSRRGKKRARGYEGDEVFKVTRDVICPTVDGGKVVLAAFDVIHLLLRNPNLASPLQSISCRLLLSVLFALPQLLPASLSPDLSLHEKVLKKVQSITADLSSGTTSVMSKSLGLVIGASIADGNSEAFSHDFDILLHPRVPPLVRSMPHVESLSLFRAEESKEEIDAREALGLETEYVAPPTPVQEAIELDEQPISPTQNASNTTPSLAPSSSAPKTPDATPTLKSALQDDAPQWRSAQTASSAIPPSVSRAPVSPQTSTELISKTYPITTAADDDEDEEMPMIDMDSDSD